MKYISKVGKELTAKGKLIGLTVVPLVYVAGGIVTSLRINNIVLSQWWITDPMSFSAETFGGDIAVTTSHTCSIEMTIEEVPEFLPAEKSKAKNLCPICERTDVVCRDCGLPAPYVGVEAGALFAKAFCGEHAYDNFKHGVKRTGDMCLDCQARGLVIFQPAKKARISADAQGHSFSSGSALLKEARAVYMRCNEEWLKYALRKRALVPR